MDRASFPPELANFVTITESISTKGECMDANLEEKNKDSKVWQHGEVTALDWLRIFHNLQSLTSASVKHGVRQGRPLSGILFTIVMESPTI